MKNFTLSLLGLLAITAGNAQIARADVASCDTLTTEITSVADEVSIFAATALTQTRSGALSTFTSETSSKYRSVVKDLAHEMERLSCVSDTLGPKHKLQSILRALNEVAQYANGSACEVIEG